MRSAAEVRSRVGALSARRLAEGRVDPSALAVLALLDPAGLEPDAQVDLVVGLERVKHLVDGLQQAAMAAVVASTQDLGIEGELARHEMGAALHLSPHTASERTEVAVELVRRCPATLAALSAGEISYGQAAHLAAELAGTDLCPALRAEVESRVLAEAPGQTVAETKRATRAALLAADPGAALTRHQKAVRARTVQRIPLHDAMEALWVTMPASVSADVWASLSARAKAEQTARAALGIADPGLNALRVDALVALVLGQTGPAAPGPGPGERNTLDPADAYPELPDAGEIGLPVGAVGASRPELVVQPLAPTGERLPRCSCGGGQTAAVVIDLPTLLGLAEHPGEVPGHGPIPAELAREMAWSRDWVRWTTDPGTRQVLDHGAARYRPSDRLRRLVAARDRICGFPGCLQPAAVCDCDHVVTFRHHGETVTINLGPLCRQHHNAKTHGRWRLHYMPDTATKTWTSPLGKTYTKTTEPPLRT